MARYTPAADDPGSDPDPYDEPKPAKRSPANPPATNPPQVADASILRQLATPFPPAMVKAAPAGKYGEYVPHSDVNQRALSIVGFYDFDVVQVIRGYAEEIKTRDHTWPSRADAIVGVVCRLTIRVEGEEHSISEVGTEDNPAMNNDAENLKNAVSDAFKRCWMRNGLGLHLWCEKGGAGYWLDRQLDKHDPSEA